jgi:hypothetical protein
MLGGRDARELDALLKPLPDRRLFRPPDGKA